MHSVVVSDLDGTLLNHQHEVSEHSKSVIRRLNAAGIKFVLATGRHHLDVERLADELDISMYLITSNGARVHNPHGQVIIKHDIFPEFVPELIALGREYEATVHMNMYQEDNWYIEQQHEWTEKYSDEDKFAYTVKDFDTVEMVGVSKFFFAAETHEALVPLEQRVRDRLGEQASVTFSMPNCLEIMAPGVCKGVALAEVLKLKGHAFKDVIAFGDGLNDYEMLQEVGKGLVMGNADRKLKALLPEHEVIGNCNDDAVARYLERHFAH